MAESIHVNQDTVLRGADQQEPIRRNRNLLYQGPEQRLLPPHNPGGYARVQAGAANIPITAHATYTTPDAAVLPGATRAQPGLRIQSFHMQNRAGAAITMGIGFRYSNRIWSAGEYDDSATNQLIANANYQSRTATSLIVGSLVNDGIVIFSRKKFNWVSLNVTTASTDSGNSMTIECAYTDEDGLDSDTFKNDHAYYYRAAEAGLVAAVQTVKEEQ